MNERMDELPNEGRNKGRKIEKLKQEWPSNLLINEL
jgi:hypothetical protein